MHMFTKLAVTALAAALVALPASAFADSTVSGQNRSDAPVAESGTATGENEASLQGGPQATGADSASSSQNGENSASVRQDARTRSGDAPAGSQVTGSVGGDTTVQNQNDSLDPESLTGDAESINIAEGFLGPVADADIAQANQIGPNDVGLDQITDNGTGDALAGSQVTGLVA